MNFKNILICELILCYIFSNCESIEFCQSFTQNNYNISYGFGGGKSFDFNGYIVIDNNYWNIKKSSNNTIDFVSKTGEQTEGFGKDYEMAFFMESNEIGLIKENKINWRVFAKYGKSVNFGKKNLITMELEKGFNPSAAFAVNETIFGLMEQNMKNMTIEGKFERRFRYFNIDSESENAINLTIEELEETINWSQINTKLKESEKELSEIEDKINLKTIEKLNNFSRVLNDLKNKLNIFNKTLSNLNEKFNNLSKTLDIIAILGPYVIKFNTNNKLIATQNTSLYTNNIENNRHQNYTINDYLIIFKVNKTLNYCFIENNCKQTFNLIDCNETIELKIDTNSEYIDKKGLSSLSIAGICFAFVILFLTLVFFIIHFVYPGNWTDSWTINWPNTSPDIESGANSQTYGYRSETNSISSKT